MPKIPRIGSRECLAALQRMGFGIARQKGSHIAQRQIERHRQLAPIADLGVSRKYRLALEEFLCTLAAC